MRVVLKNNFFKLAVVMGLLLAATLVGTLKFEVFQATNLAAVGLMAGVWLLALLLLGIKRDNSAARRDVWQIMAIYIMAYFLITYLLGLVVGFVKNGYSLNAWTMLGNVWPVALFVVLEELLRYTLVKRTGGKLPFLLATVVIFTTVEGLLGFRAYNLSVPMELFEMIGTLGLVGLASNGLLTYVAYKSGYKTTIFYHLIFALSAFVLPILPNLGPYITAVCGVLLPTLILMRLNAYFVTQRPIPGREHKLRRWLTLAPVTSVLILVVLLVSGIFRYYAMAVGSDSMAPSIQTGDAVIIDQRSGLPLDEIAVGTVVAFRHDGRVVVHRLIAKDYDGSDVRAQTKGDNNKDSDSWTIGERDLVGIVKLKLPLVGWPTVMLERSLEQN